MREAADRIDANISKPPSPKPELGLLSLVVILAAALAHLTFYWTMPAMVWPDSVRFEMRSTYLPTNLAAGQWDLWTPPGYPFFLWLCHFFIQTVEGVIFVQQLLAIATCFFLWLALRKLCGWQSALLGSVIVAFSPHRHYYAQNFLSESLSEFLFVTGLAWLILAVDTPFPRMIRLRMLAGLALGAAVLARGNLVPTILAVIFPVGIAAGEGRWQRFLGGMLAVGLTWGVIVFPWLAFNSSRGVYGVTGNVGYALHESANDYGIGERVPLEGLREFVNYTPQVDREMQRTAWARFRNYPKAYWRAVNFVASVLFSFYYPQGDVPVVIPLCSGFAPLPTLNVFRQQSSSAVGSGWRCSIHASLCQIYNNLLWLGWIGLVGYGVVALYFRRFDAVILIIISLVCIVSLCVIIRGNVRYAFPFQAFALGLGVPAIGRFLKNGMSFMLPLAKQAGRISVRAKS